MENPFLPLHTYDLVIFLQSCRFRVCIINIDLFKGRCTNLKGQKAVLSTTVLESRAESSLSLSCAHHFTFTLVHTHVFVEKVRVK